MAGGRARAEHRRLRLGGPLRLDGLAVVDRRAAVTGLCLTAASGVAVLVAHTPAAPKATPAVVVVGLIGLAAAAALLVMAALSEGWRGRRWPLVLVGVVGALASASGGRGLAGAVGLEQAPPPARPLLLVLHALVWVGVASALVVAATPLAPARDRRVLLGAAAALPFAVAALGFAASAWLSHWLPVDTVDWVTAGLQGLFPLSVLVAGTVTLGLVGAGIRFARGVTVRALGFADAGWALAVLLLIKTLWLAAARLNGAVHAVPELVSPWQASNAERPVQWIVAALLAAGVLALVAHAARLRIGEGPVAAAAVAAAGLFLAPMAVDAFTGIVGLLGVLVNSAGDVVAFGLVAGGVLLLRARPHARAVRLASAAAVLAAAGASLLLPEDLGTARVLIPAAGQVTDRWPTEQAMAAVVVLLGVAGAVLLRRRPTRSAGLFLVLFSLWALPVAVVLLATAGGFAVTPIAPGLLTFDTAVTMAVGAAGLAWWRGWQRTLDPAPLVLVLVVVWVATHGVALLPEPWRVSLFGLLVVLPVAYLLLVEAGAMTAAMTTRGSRVLGLVALCCGLLSLVALLIDSGVMGPQRTVVFDLAAPMFAVPLAAFTVVATRTMLPAPAHHAVRPAEITGPAAASRRRR